MTTAGAQMPSATIAVSAHSSIYIPARDIDAEQAKRTACVEYTNGYKHNTASVAEMRQYADCVYVLHPTPLSAADVLWVKAAIIVGLVVAATVWYSRRGDGLCGAAVAGFIGAMAGSLSVWVVWVLSKTLHFFVT